MINIDEIREVAAQVSLANTVVEKDYALGWLLMGIFQHPFTKNSWVFKGGTCLKKCYFETYRFSEDLDFSFCGKTPPTVDELNHIFADISDLIYEASGMEFQKASIEFEMFRTPRGAYSIQGGIKYRGPVRPNVGLAQMQRIKIDLTLDEPLVLPAVIKQVEHRYSDNPSSGFLISAYHYEEVFAEKIRALAQRLRPRDLYDVIHLHRRMDLEPDRDVVYSTLEKKCALRGVAIPTIKSVEKHDNWHFLQSEWETQLKHQIPILPNFQSFLSDLPQLFKWLKGEKIEELNQLLVSKANESESAVKKEAVSSLFLPGKATSFLDCIRFSAANRLIVTLGYNGTCQDIEPYSFARSSDGHLLLQTVQINNRESQAYSWDKIQSVKITKKTFIPKFIIEITSAGHLPVHQFRSVRPTL